MNRSDQKDLIRKRKQKEGIAWSLFFLTLGFWGFYLGLTSPTGHFRIWQGDPQDVILYTESDELAEVFEGLKFQDWNLKIVVIDEPAEWEIKTVAGHGAHLVLIEHALMEQLNRVSLLETAKIRVPLFSYLYPDFRKQDWEKVYLPLFWHNDGSQLKEVKVWGFSVPQNSPDRKLSWKAFYELVSHENFKARLMQSNLGLTLQEFEESAIPATRKPSFVRQKPESTPSPPLEAKPVPVTKPTPARIPPPVAPALAPHPRPLPAIETNVPQQPAPKTEPASPLPTNEVKDSEPVDTP